MGTRPACLASVGAWLAAPTRWSLTQLGTENSGRKVYPGIHGSLNWAAAAAASQAHTQRDGGALPDTLMTFSASAPSPAAA